MSKHTLGPWQVIEPRTAMLGECYSIRTIAAPADIWNGYVGGVVYSSPNAKANAALIAAAPDLLAALREVVEWLDNTDSVLANARTIEQARVAIAKAEGVS